MLRYAGALKIEVILFDQAIFGLPLPTVESEVYLLF